MGYSGGVKTSIGRCEELLAQNAMYVATSAVCEAGVRLRDRDASRTLERVDEALRALLQVRNVLVEEA